MIDEIIHQHRLKSQQQNQKSETQQLKQASRQQTIVIFQKDEFFLIAVINLILSTIRLSIFNIIFLFTFITSCLKFYKTYLMDKHADEIEIESLKMDKKNRSVFIHYLAKFISDLLTQKDLKKNAGLCIFVILAYLVFRFIALNWILMIIINVEYLTCLKRRWSEKKQAERKRKILENLMSPNKIKNRQSIMSTKSTNPNSYYPPHYPYQNLKPIGESFGQINMQKSVESNTSQSYIPSKDMIMSMIEEEEENEKFQFDQELPQYSSQKININEQKKFLQQSNEQQKKQNEKKPNHVQHKQSLIEIYESDSLSIEAQSEVYDQQHSTIKLKDTKAKKL